jgi:K+-transporting ATPase ATPase B chain
MSVVHLDGRERRKGSFDAIVQYCAQNGHKLPPEVEQAVKDISNSGGTPLLVAENRRILGTIHLKDIIKGGMRERFDQLRAMGIHCDDYRR